MSSAERNIAGYMLGGRFIPIRSGVRWPKAKPGKRRPDPRQDNLPYDEVKAGDFDRSRKLQPEDMTLTQFVRSIGGIRPDRGDANLGEWRRLTYHESGVRGLAIPRGKNTAEGAADRAREAGFSVPRDPNKFLEVLEADAAGQRVIHHPEWYEREAERQYMARQNGLFTDEDVRRAKRVTATHLKGQKVKYGKRTATISNVIISRDGTMLLDIGSGTKSEYVEPSQVVFTNPLISKQKLLQLARKVIAGQQLKSTYRREVSLRNEITRAKRDEDAANKQAENAPTRGEARRWERAAAAAYKRRVKAEAQLAKARTARQQAAQRASTAYANGRPERNAILVSGGGGSDSEVRSVTVNTGPALARRMLATNVGNRPVDQAFVNKIAEVMTRGIYKRRKPITFTNGILTDGQHTLLAIIKSGVTIPLKVQYKKLSAKPPRPRAAAQNPLGDNLIQGAAAGAAGSVVGAVTGALLVPIITKYVQGRKEKRAALAAVHQNPAQPNAATAGVLASLGRARLILAARERTAAEKADSEQRRQQAARYTAEGLELLRRAALAYPVHGNPITVTPRAVERLHREFRGFPTSGEVTPYYTPKGSPDDAPYLGRLHKIILADGRELTFESNPAALLGTVRGRRRLFIGLSHPYKMPNGADPNSALDYGAVVEVQYITPKPHLYGDFTDKLFFHELGEEGGKCPHLVLQNGRLSFRGGSYTIKREGIRN